MGRRRRRRVEAQQAAAVFGPAADADAKPKLAPLHCPQCNAPLPLGAGAVATCAFCQTATPLPDDYRAMRDAEAAARTDRAAAEALYAKLGKPSKALDAWVKLTELAGGAVVAIVVGLLSVSAVLAFLAGFALELVLRFVAPVLGIDLIDRFGGGTVYAAFALGLVVFVLLPWWLNGYLQTAGAIRKTLQTNLAAKPPERPGFPATCRVCDAALDVPPGALGARCAYCEADNLVALPVAVVRDTRARQASFHRSIVGAAARAAALRADARKGLPKSARNCAIFVVAFGAIGHACTALDIDHDDTPTWHDSMGAGTSPRKLVPTWDRARGVPENGDFTMATLEYVVALRRHETIEISSPGTVTGSISADNLTTFPFTTRHWEAAWSALPGGRSHATWRAPYTGLFKINVGGVGDDRVHWRLVP